MVRVWSPDGDESREGLRGTALHLASGRSLTFTGPDELIPFLAATEPRRAAAPRPIPAPPGGADVVANQDHNQQNAP